ARSDKADGSGTGLAPGPGVYGKFVCQTTKSAPSTSPSPSASPCAKVAPLAVGKCVCQATKSAPSTSPSPSKSPGCGPMGGPSVKKFNRPVPLKNDAPSPEAPYSPGACAIPFRYNDLMVSVPE